MKKNYFVKFLTLSVLSLNVFANTPQVQEQTQLFGFYPFLGSVTTGTAPWGIAMNGTLAAVANNTSGNVVFFDTLTQGIVGNIPFDPVGGGLAGIAMSGNHGAVVDENSRKVYFFSTSPFSSTGSVQFNDFNQYGPIAMNGTLALVPSNTGGLSSNKVNFIDTSIPAIIGTINFPSSSYTIDVSINGTLAAVLNRSSKNVNLIDTDMQKVIGTVNLAPSLLGQIPNNIALNGTLAAVSAQSIFMGTPSKVVLFDTSNKSIVGSVTFSSTNPIARGVALQGTLGAVVTSPTGTASSGYVNFFDTTTFQVLGTVDAGIFAWGVAMSGTVGGVTNSGATTVTLFGIPAAPTPSPVNASNFKGQAAETANYFNSLNQKSQFPNGTEGIYTLVQGLSVPAQESAFTQLAPQFKIIQFAEEKLDLLLHKEIQDELYRSKNHKQAFVIGGYDNLKQNAKNGYVGYSVNSFYQMLGTCFERVGMNWLFGAGVSESYMSLTPIGSYADYVSTWGSFGFAKLFKNWFVGLDSLFGYSFLNTHRKVSFLNEKANSSHGLWNISFDGKFGYQFKRGKFCMKAYDIFGYICGHENDYTETGISGDNYFVQNENISQIRNQLGVKLSKDFRTYYSGFLDAAYVYEYYTNDNKFQAALVGTSVFQTFTQTIPTKNYGRVHAGFEGTYDSFVWRLAYTGLYGSHLEESSVSLKLGAKY